MHVFGFQMSFALDRLNLDLYDKKSGEEKDFYTSLFF